MEVPVVNGGHRVWGDGLDLDTDGFLSGRFEGYRNTVRFQGQTSGWALPVVSRLLGVVGRFALMCRAAQQVGHENQHFCSVASCGTVPMQHIAECLVVA